MVTHLQLLLDLVQLPLPQALPLARTSSQLPATTQGGTLLPFYTVSVSPTSSSFSTSSSSLYPRPSHWHVLAANSQPRHKGGHCSLFILLVCHPPPAPSPPRLARSPRHAHWSPPRTACGRQRRRTGRWLRSGYTSWRSALDRPAAGMHSCRRAAGVHSCRRAAGMHSCRRAARVHADSCRGSIRARQRPRQGSSPARPSSRQKGLRTRLGAAQPSAADRTVMAARAAIAPANTCTASRASRGG